MPHTAVVSEAQQHQRLDSFATGLLPELSRSSVQKLCQQEKVKVNGKAARASYRVRAGDLVSVAATAHARPSPINLPILYEDADCVVIDKPAGTLTHSKGAFNPEPTVATFIHDRLQPEMKGERAGIVHRLDRSTSGLIICAKHQTALTWMQKQFATRKVEKTYRAIVAGGLAPAEAVIDMPIGRHPRRPQTFRVAQDGRPASTTYKVISEHAQHSLLELKPHTGRTHQLRVHLAQIGHPIIGDTLYGGAPAGRLMLHAAELGLVLPNRRLMQFTSDLPAEFQAFWESAA